MHVALTSNFEILLETVCIFLYLQGIDFFSIFREIEVTMNLFHGILGIIW